MTHRAFLAMPFRAELRWIRESIRSAANALGIQLRAVDETLVPGEEIVPGIRQEIRAASFAYVVLTDLNPNVMYELGLLHEASKPTILIADSDTVGHLPFDIQSRMIITFDQHGQAPDDLTQALITATDRLLALFDKTARDQFVLTNLPNAPTNFGAVQISLGSLDWEKIKNGGAKAVGRSGCNIRNISSHDDGSFKGWRLKARCMNGDTILVYVDLNGDIVSVDVE